jgi:hypothetical protein
VPLVWWLSRRLGVTAAGACAIITFGCGCVRAAVFERLSALANSAHPNSTAPKPDASIPLFQAALAADERRGRPPIVGVRPGSATIASPKNDDAPIVAAFLLAKELALGRLVLRSLQGVDLGVGVVQRLGSLLELRLVGCDFCVRLLKGDSLVAVADRLRGRH